MSEQQKKENRGNEARGRRSRTASDTPKEASKKKQAAKSKKGKAQAGHDKKTASDKAKKHKQPSGDKKSNGTKNNGSSDKQNAKRAGGNGNKRRRTEYRRHVNLEHKRPELSRGAAAGNTSDLSASRGKSLIDPARRNFMSPEKDPKAVLKVIPLGGLDAIGKNMTVFECGNDIVLDDAGCMFPDDSHPGIDLILPDYSYLLQNAEKLRGIVITHGHEDHTGALPYVMKDLDCEVPIYGTKLTLGLIEGKFKEHHVRNAKLVEIKPGQSVKMGCFTANFFAVNHSIPGSVGIFFNSPAGNVLHTGDFKLDQTPIDGITTDFGAIAEYGRAGVDLMMSDSTNANIPTFTPSEAEVGKVLNRIIAQATGRVVIASFASHIHRMQQICDAAIANGRKVVVTGRSMVQNTDIARRLGYLHISDDDLLDAYYMKDVPPEKVVVMCTGSQGEPLSALARIAGGLHKTISLDRGDTVIISASPVPGNEKAVTNIMNLLSKIGCDVWDKKRARVHVSGHAGAEELKIMLSIAKPKAFMPVHGEAIHLRAHAKLGEATGVPPENIFILDNGDTLELSAHGVERGETVQNGIVLVDGLRVGDTSEEVLNERSDLAEQGFATIAAAVDRGSRRIVGNVQVEMHGITSGEDVLMLKDATSRVTKKLSEALQENRTTKELKKASRNALLDVLWRNIKQRPMVIVNILEV
ncbi:MAG: ribonuclease J [Eggerthellaceae bacterium]|jgi:ribonuclease J